MERRADLESNDLRRARRLGELHQPLDRPDLAGDDDLGGRVHVRRRHDARDARLLTELLEPLPGQSDHGGHGARPLRLSSVHELAAKSHEPEAVGERDGAARDRGRVLAEAVARNEGRLNAAT